jgi:hypothetical protein
MMAGPRLLPPTRGVEWRLPFPARSILRGVRPAAQSRRHRSSALRRARRPSPLCRKMITRAGDISPRPCAFHGATKPRSVACFFHPGLFLSAEAASVVGATCLIRIQFRFSAAQAALRLYQVVKTQAGPETVDPQIACRVCNGPLAAREGQFVLKYFLLREASRLDARRARQGFLRAKPTAPTLGFLPSGASNRQMQLSFVQGCGSGMAGRQ